MTTIAAGIACSVTNGCRNARGQYMRRIPFSEIDQLRSGGFNAFMDAVRCRVYGAMRHAEGHILRAAAGATCPPNKEET